MAQIRRNELLISFPSRDYFSGDKFEGYAELRLPYGLKMYGVKLEMIGRELANVNNRQEMNEFLRIVSVLPGPGSKERNKGLFGIFNTKRAESLPPGTYKYPFSFVLPEHIPPTFSSEDAHIDYEVRVIVEPADKAMSLLTSVAKLQVGGSLFDLNFLGNKSTPVQVKESKTFFMTKGSLDVTVSLDSEVFLSGDIIKGRFSFVNDSGKRINNITVKLLQNVEIFIGGRSVKKNEYQLAFEDLGPLASKQQKHPTIELRVPTTVPESVFQKQSISGVAGKVVQISYEIFVHGEVTLGYDLRLNIPIYIVQPARHQMLSPPTDASMMMMGVAPVPAAVAAPLQQPAMMPQMAPASGVGGSGSGLYHHATGGVPPEAPSVPTGTASGVQQWQDSSMSSSPPVGDVDRQPHYPSTADSGTSIQPSESLYPSLAFEGAELDFTYQSDIKRNLPPPPRRSSLNGKPLPPQCVRIDQQDDSDQEEQLYNQFYE